jgi:hypothetical protein
MFEQIGAKVHLNRTKGAIWLVSVKWRCTLAPELRKRHHFVQKECTLALEATVGRIGAGTENREQRTENREQRTENREQRTENREQRTENREQRTENREQRAENRE